MNDRCAHLRQRSSGLQHLKPVLGHQAAAKLSGARSRHSIQATGITPDIEVLQDVPDNMKAQTDTKGEASLRGHLKAEGAEQTGSQSYVPPNESDDKAIKMGLDLLRGSASNAAFPILHYRIDLAEFSSRTPRQMQLANAFCRYLEMAVKI